MMKLDHWPPNTPKYYVKNFVRNTLIFNEFQGLLYISTYPPKYDLWKAFHKVYLSR